MATEESQFKLMRLIEANPKLSQRELARKLGVSVGGVNYCLKALVTKGWVKVQNFSRSSNKLGYAYLLTPSGIAAKAGLTNRYLKIKLREYEELKAEITRLETEVAERRDRL